MNDVQYSCSEQFFTKFKQELFDCFNLTLANQIMSARKPAIIKQLGRQVRNFDEKAWNLNRDNVMYTALINKFKQNPDLKRQLLATGNAILVEASPRDRLWGIGFSANDALANKAKWGQNKLGNLLMRVRNELQ